MRKFLFFYLNTGGGHLMPAKVLKSHFNNLYPNSCEVKLINGFNKRNYIDRFFYEKIYSFSIKYAPGLYSGIYRVKKNFLHKVFFDIIYFFEYPYLKKIISQEKPDDIIIFHHALANGISRVVRKLGLQTKLTVIVLDPFSLHFSWFYEIKNINFLVYSQSAYDEAVKYGVKPEKIQIVPFLLSPKMMQIFSENRIEMIKNHYNISKNEKTLLITGGGEGLPVTYDIVKNLCERNFSYNVIAVCGKNRKLKRKLDHLKEKNPQLKLQVFGFVNNMDQLLQISDLVITKAGPSTIMEAVYLKKPMILCQFIYGQELGNVDFALDNNLGFFYNDPQKICDTVLDLFNNGEKLIELTENLGNIPLDFNSEKIVDILLRM